MTDMTEIENLCAIDHVTGSGMVVIADDCSGPGEFYESLVLLLSRDGCDRPEEGIARLVRSGRLLQRRSGVGEPVVLLEGA